jgi:glutaredoxin
MRFGIHNLLREKIEQFSDEEEENIEVEETDNEEHEEEEEMEEMMEEEQEKDEETGSRRLPTDRLSDEAFKSKLHADEVG